MTFFLTSQLYHSFVAFRLQVTRERASESAFEREEKFGEGEAWREREMKTKSPKCAALVKYHRCEPGSQIGAESSSAAASKSIVSQPVSQLL